MSFAMAYARSTKLAAVAAAAAVAALIVCPISTGAPARAAEPVTSAFGEAAAKQLAAKQNVRVEVTSLRSETDQVFANPSGTLTREQFLEPVRVRRGSEWLGVDSTLVQGADGSWAPRVSSVAMKFSGGGTTPVVTTDVQNTRLELSWPGTLPTPKVEGNTVTYAEVIPGVDLEMAAVGTSFTQHLVVKTREAGRDPRVRAFTLKSRVHGGALVQNGTGYAVKGRDGKDVMIGAQPVMWDSKIRPAGVASKALQGVISRLDDGDRQAPMGLSVAKNALTIRPDTAVLDDPSTVYPLVLDPTTNPSIYNWAMVNKTFPTTSYYNFTDQDQGVGYNNFESPAVTKRIYFSWPTSGYNGKIIRNATLSAYETYSATCAAGTVNAYLAHDFSSGVTWNTQPAKDGGVQDGWSTKAGRSDCYAGGKMATWDVTSGVTTRTGAGASRSTFVLQGASETTYSSWMRFAGSKYSDTTKRPKLSVEYNTPPSKTTKTTMWVPTNATACATTGSGPAVNPSTGAVETVYAKISDPDGDNVSATLQINTSAGGVNKYTANFASRASGSVIAANIPSTLADGLYYFRVTVSDGKNSSGYGDICFFTVDKTKPASPVITSNTWTEGVLAPQTATTGQFTMTSSGATSMVYRWMDSPTPLTSSAPGGSFTVGATTTKTFQEWRATGKDTAGNTGGTTGFFVKRTQPGKLAEYLFNGRVPSDTAPALCTAPNYEATCDTANQQLNSEVALADADSAAAYTFNLAATQANFEQGRWGDAVGNNGLALDGAMGSVATLPSRPVVNENSFAIGTWAALGDKTQSRTLLSQERDATPADPANPVLSYDVGYDATTDKFVVRLMNAFGGVLVQATDGLPAMNPSDPQQPLDRAGSWVYLVVVYDAAAGTLRLDALASASLNPPDSAFATYTRGTPVAFTGTPLVGKGDFLIGGGSSAHGARAAWQGTIDNLAVWQGVPTDTTLLSNANAQR